MLQSQITEADGLVAALQTEAVDLASETEETKQRAAEVIWRFAQGAIMRHGIFNGDPHPGNYKFHHDGSVTFLDYGLVKRWSPGEWESLRPTVDAIIIERDPELLVREMVNSGFLPAGHGLDPEGVEGFQRKVGVYFHMVH